MNILNSLKTFGQNSWALKSTSTFSAEDIASTNKAVVVDSQFGPSVCFFLKSGLMSYIPVARDSTLAIGQEVDLTKVEVLTLGREGEADILRVK